MKIDFMGVVVPFCILLPIFFAIVNWRFLTIESKVILYFLIVSAITNLTGTIIGKVYHTNNMPLIHLFTVLEVLMLSFFYQIILSNKKNIFFYRAFSISFLVVCILNALFFQSIFTYCSYTRSIAAISLMILAINLFAKKAADDYKPYLMSNFYFNTAIFIYYSGGFVLFIFSNFTLVGNMSKDDFTIIWNIHGVLTIIMYILFSIGFILCKK